MGRKLFALFVVVAAFLRGDLLHPSPFYSLWLPLLGVAAFVYLMMRLFADGSHHGSDSADGGTKGDRCSWNDGDCGGGDGGGD